MSHSSRRPKFVKFDDDDLAYEADLKAQRREQNKANRGRDVRDRCERTGKIIHRKADTARKVAKQHRREHQDANIEAYLCPHCGFWHVGHARHSQEISEDLARRYKIKEPK